MSTVANACQNSDGAAVAVEGYLRLPNLMQARVDPETELTSYELSLVDDRGVQEDALNVIVVGTRSNAANRIAELPADGYTKRDLRIFTERGETLSSLERVRVTGEMLKGRSGGHGGPCTLAVGKIEKQ